jgi:hypothetical protein
LQLKPGVGAGLECYTCAIPTLIYPRPMMHLTRNVMLTCRQTIHFCLLHYIHTSEM